MRIFGCSSWIDTDRPGGNPILKSENGKGSFVSFRQLSSMCANPHSCQSTLLLCLKWQLVQQCCKVSPEQKSVSSLKVESCLKVSSQVESCRAGCRWWRLSLPHPVVATCRHLRCPRASQRHTESRRVSPSVTVEAGRPRTGSGIGPRARGPPSSRHRHM